MTRNIYFTLLKTKTNAWRSFIGNPPVHASIKKQTLKQIRWFLLFSIPHIYIQPFKGVLWSSSYSWKLGKTLTMQNIKNLDKIKIFIKVMQNCFIGNTLPRCIWQWYHSYVIERFDQVDLMLYLEMQSFLSRDGNGFLCVISVEEYNFVDKIYSNTVTS